MSDGAGVQSGWIANAGKKRKNKELKIMRGEGNIKQQEQAMMPLGFLYKFRLRSQLLEALTGPARNEEGNVNKGRYEVE